MKKSKLLSLLAAGVAVTTLAACSDLYLVLGGVCISLSG